MVDKGNIYINCPLYDIVTTESGTELEVDELAIQEVPLQEVIHLQEETCVTIG
jgi:hypothetical protein